MLFNADIGEGIGNESQLLPFLHTCNISCGAHAGSLAEIQAAITLAIKYKVKIGAHPSFEDRKNFGRKALQISNEELYRSIKKQLEFLYHEVDDQNGKMIHVKPHGALYHEASLHKEIAQAIVQATIAVDSSLAIVGMPKTRLYEVAKQLKCTYINEGFADRLYQENGSLAPRNIPNAVITDTKQVIKQVGEILHHNQVDTMNNSTLKLDVDTICFHGDTDNAIDLLKACYNTYVV